MVKYSLGIVSVIQTTTMTLFLIALLLDVREVVAFSIVDTNSNYYQPQHSELRRVVERSRSRRQQSVLVPTVVATGARLLSATTSTTVGDRSDDYNANANANDVIPTPTAAGAEAPLLLSEEKTQQHHNNNTQTQNHNNTQNHDGIINSTTIDVVFEDADYFFVNKPPGMVCTGGEISGGGTGSVSFHDRVKAYGRTRYGYQPGLLHRLDQGTSGLMVYAKSLGAAQHFCRLQNERGAITKQYIAVVQGAPPYHKRSGRIEGGICKSNKDLRTYIIAKGRKSGKRVLTTYKVIRQVTAVDQDQDQQQYPGLGVGRGGGGQRQQQLTWLSLRLFTGRKHQIRASCRKMGCPIVGDTMYGGPRHPVMLLHAHTLVFTSVNGTTEYNVTVTPPSSWKDFGGVS